MYSVASLLLDEQGLEFQPAAHLVLAAALLGEDVAMWRGDKLVLAMGPRRRLELAPAQEWERERHPSGGHLVWVWRAKPRLVR